MSDPGDVGRLARHWRAIVEYGDDPAQGYRAHGIACRARGRWSAAAESFIHAGRLARDPIARASLPIGAIDSLARDGRIEEGVLLGRRLARRLLRLGQSDLAGRALLNAGNAVLWADRYREAKQLLERAIERLETPSLAVGARLGLSTCELYGGSTARSLELADQALAEFEALDQDYSAALCRLNRGQAHLLLGRPDQALSDLLSARDRLSGPDLARTEEFLGDTYLRLQLAPEAIDAYERALALGATPLNTANCRLGLGMARDLSGRPREARTEFARAERAYRKVNNAVWESVAALDAARLAHDRSRATRVADRLKSVGGPYHRCWSSIVVLEMAGSNPLPAEIARALRDVRRGGFIDLEWRLWALRARSAAPRERLRLYRRMLDSILEARLLIRSHLARTQYLVDKSEAVREYLSLLLARGRAPDVREALEAVTALRSAALVDEVLSARPGALSAESRAQLEVLRSELSVSGESSGGSRRARVGRPSVSLRRAWREICHHTVNRLSSPFGPATPATVFVLGDRAYRLGQGRSTPLGLGPADLRRELRMIEYDLLEPTICPDGDPAAVLCRIERLAERLFESGMGFIGPICPDGELWQVPWQAVISALDPARSALLVPTPRFGGTAIDLRLPRRPAVTIWAGQAGDIPHVRAEVRAVLAAFPEARVCTTAAEVLESLEGGRIDLLHAATHGRLDASNPMFSSLELGGQRLFAADLARARVRPKLVFLSACETARLTALNRDEPDGLARAFLALGAEAVVGSQWPLDDAIASIFTGHAIEALAGGATLGEAMRSGRNKARSLRSHPYFWASMVSIGGFSGT